MKFIHIIKGSRTAKICSVVLGLSLLGLIFSCSLSSLPGTVNYPEFKAGLEILSLIFGGSLGICACIIVFFLLKARLGTFRSLFIMIFSLEGIGMLAGAVMFAFSLSPRISAPGLGVAMSYYYYFLSLLIMAASLLCAIASSAILAICVITRSIIRKKRNR